MSARLPSLLTGLFQRTTLTARQERAVQKTLQHLRQQRRKRFRVLACIDGSEERQTVASRAGGGDVAPDGSGVADLR